MIRLLPLSKGCQNALKVVVFLSTKPEGAIVPRAETSRHTKIPSLFLAKILQTLGRAGLLRSHLGAQRGYSLIRPAEQISILDVVKAYDGPLEQTSCVLDGSKYCPGDRTCALHNRWLKTQKEVLTNLSSINVVDVTKTLTRRRNGNTNRD